MNYVVFIFIYSIPYYFKCQPCDAVTNVNEFPQRYIISYSQRKYKNIYNGKIEKGHLVNIVTSTKDMNTDNPVI